MIVVFADLTGTKGWHTFLDIAAGIDGLWPRTVAGRCVAGTAAVVSYLQTRQSSALQAEWRVAVGD